MLGFLIAIFWTESKCWHRTLFRGNSSTDLRGIARILGLRNGRWFLDGAGGRSRFGGAEPCWERPVKRVTASSVAAAFVDGRWISSSVAVATAAVVAGDGRSDAAQFGGWSETRADLLSGECYFGEEGGWAGTAVRPHVDGGSSGRRGGDAGVYRSEADFVRWCHWAWREFCGLRDSFIRWKCWHTYVFYFPFRREGNNIT